MFVFFVPLFQSISNLIIYLVCELENSFLKIFKENGSEIFDVICF